MIQAVFYPVGIRNDLEFIDMVFGHLRISLALAFQISV